MIVSIEEKKFPPLHVIYEDISDIWMNVSSTLKKISHECSCFIEFIKRVGEKVIKCECKTNKFNNTGT